MEKQVNRKKTIIFFILFGIVSLMITSYQIGEFLLKPIGKSKVEINYNEKYQDQGAKFKLFSFDLSKYIKTTSNVNEQKTGVYEVSYSLPYFPLPLKRIRIVQVVDRFAPMITLKGDTTVKMCPSGEYQEEGYQAYDEYDGDLTNQVIKEQQQDKIIYKVKDKSSNQAIIERKLIKIDEEAPEIKLKGNATVYLKLNEVYQEEGYEVIDNCDQKVEVDITNDINTSQVGKYTVTYQAIDKSGNSKSISRQIIVYNENETGIIYLTFDDGPSNTGSTAKILDILKKENVKATFFVTTKGSDDLIRREYLEGHQVALHTSSHDYSYVYQSIDNYFADLYAVRDRVYRITGVYSNIIRFPGGSNNTVSNRYYNGIMDILTKEVVNRGYYYFDWNISSGDAGGCQSSDCVYQNVVNHLSKSKNNIVLMHDIKMFTADAIEDIIRFGKMQGYTFKVIDESTIPIRFK